MWLSVSLILKSFFEYYFQVSGSQSTLFYPPDQLCGQLHCSYCYEQGTGVFIIFCWVMQWECHIRIPIGESRIPVFTSLTHASKSTTSSFGSGREHLTIPQQSEAFLMLYWYVENSFSMLVWFTQFGVPSFLFPHLWLCNLVLFLRLFQTLLLILPQYMTL